MAEIGNSQHVAVNWVQADRESPDGSWIDTRANLGATVGRGLTADRTTGH
jgi:hypothetical protein